MFKRRHPLSRIERFRQMTWPKSGWRRAFSYHWHRLKRLQGTPSRIARGFACGVFASFTPFIGLHLLICFAAAWLMRGSFIASVVGTFIGNPLTFPLIWLASYNVGTFILGRDNAPDVAMAADELNVFDQVTGWQSLVTLWDTKLFPMVVGGVPLGLIAAALIFFPARSAVRTYKRRREARALTRQPMIQAQAE
ncbi:MAG: DUF2062 domain-containing protein [Pseudomonadota bacterium]